MDYILTSMLQHHSMKLHKVFSYNIACQWSKHVLGQLMALLWQIQPKSISSYIMVIPKLHVNAHNPPCPTDFSLNYIDSAGRTDGEAIECTHAMTGLLSGSTKQMGPGYRHDALDTHWQFWNWQKIIGLGMLITHKPTSLDLTDCFTGLLLYKKLFAAYIAADEHKGHFKRFSDLQIRDVPEWEKMVKVWEKDHSQPNPYVVTKSGK